MDTDLKDAPAKKTRGPIDPNSPQGIRNAWSKAKREHEVQASRVAKLQVELKAEEEKLRMTGSVLDSAAAKLKALL